MSLYKDPVITKYFDLIKSAVGDGVFKQYYYGDPWRVPFSSTPCIILSKSATAVSNLTNAEDEQEMELILTVITDVRNEINDSQDVAPGIAKLYDILEGRESNYKLKEKSLLHIIRNNVEVDTALNLRTDLASITRVDYGLTVGKRAPEAYAIEAQLQFVAHFIQLR